MSGGPQWRAAVPFWCAARAAPALNRAHMAVHTLMVEALLTRDREAASTRCCSTRSRLRSALQPRSVPC